MNKLQNYLGYDIYVTNKGIFYTNIESQDMDFNKNTFSSKDLANVRHYIDSLSMSKYKVNDTIWLFTSGAGFCHPFEKYIIENVNTKNIKIRNLITNNQKVVTLPSNDIFFETPSFMQILPQIINLQNNIHKINNRIIELRNEDYAIRANIEYLKDNYALSHLI
jgi:hypothetical protein